MARLPVSSRSSLMCLVTTLESKNAPIVTGRGNSCLLGLMFGGMFGLKEMR